MAKKPGIPRPEDKSFGERLKQVVETIMGRRGSKTSKMTALTATRARTTPAIIGMDRPTAAEYNALRADVDTLRIRLNTLLDQVGDYDG